MAEATTTEPGARVKGEPAKAYSAFVRYRDMKPHERTLTKAGKAFYGEDAWTSGRHRQIETWSGRWKWVRRAQEWDDHLDEQGRLAQIDEIRQMRRRHAQVGVAMLNRVAARLMGGQVIISGGQVQDVVPIDVNRLGVSALARLADVGVKIERMARGEPDVIEEHRHRGVEEADEQEIAKAMLADPALAALAARLSVALESAAS